MTAQRTLADILADLLRRAREQPGTQARASLAGGLEISIRIANGSVQLQLARTGDAPPADKELETVLNHWPEKGLLTRTKTARFTRHYLQTLVGPIE